MKRILGLEMGCKPDVPHFPIASDGSEGKEDVFAVLIERGLVEAF